MKREYISPSVEKFLLVLENNLNAGTENGASSDDSDAKQGTIIEEEEILPTQPNLWGDEED